MPTERQRDRDPYRRSYGPGTASEPAATETPTPFPTTTSTPTATPTATPAAGGFVDNFDDGVVSDWTFSGLWHLATSTGCVTPGYHSATRSFYYGQASSCNYKTGNGPNSGNTGTLTSPSISGLNTGPNAATLSFWYWRQVESYAGPYDKTYVRVSYDGGATWATVWYKDSSSPSENAWTFASVSLSPSGGTMRVRFVFDTVDGVANAFTGWLIDDVAVQNN